VRVPWSVKLGLVTGFRRPRTCKVISHEVEVVEELLGSVEVDVLEDPRPSGKGGCEKVGEREVASYGFQEEDKVSALLRVVRMFPVHYCN
jgi:hypothetical protein